MFKSISLCVCVAILFVTCTTNTPEGKSEMMTQSLDHIEDSLISLWNDAWNRNDTNAIAAMFNGKSVMIASAKYIITGADSIMNKWVNAQVKSVANLKTQKLMGASDAAIAYYSGTWTLDVTNDKDSVIGNQIGSFTSAWEKQAGGNWIMTTIEMGE